MALQGQMLAHSIRLMLTMLTGQQVRSTCRQIKGFAVPMKAIKLLDVGQPILGYWISHHRDGRPAYFFVRIFADLRPTCFGHQLTTQAMP